MLDSGSTNRKGMVMENFEFGEKMKRRTKGFAVNIVKLPNSHQNLRKFHVSVSSLGISLRKRDGLCMASPPPAVARISG